MSRVPGTVGTMQADTADGPTSSEDLQDLTAAVARLEATADALDARLAPAPGSPAPGGVRA